MKVLLEIQSGHDGVRNIRNKETQEVRAIKQEAYITLGGAYPERCTVTVEQPLQPGRYEVQLPMRIGKWGDPEVNPFAPIKVIRNLAEAKSSESKAS